MTPWILVSAAIAFAVAAYLTRRFCDPGSRLHLLDHPNERSLHTQPTPRTGGVAILTGIYSAILVLLFANVGASPIMWLMAGAGLIAALSFLDDRRGLPVVARFLGHVVGAGLVVLGAGLTLLPLSLGITVPWPVWLGLSLSVLFLVWMVNLYNFMDGMDGFAGGMALIGFGTFAVLGQLAGNFPFVAVNLVIAAAAGGFLLYNFPPARIFMGDTGSATLGLLVGGLSLWGARDGIFPFWAAPLVFSPFIVDASVTLVRRLFRGERVWQAHKSHYYQRLVQLGLGHRKTVLAEYILMLVCAGSAVWATTGSTSVQFAILGFWIFTYALLAGLVHALERRSAGDWR